MSINSNLMFDKCQKKSCTNASINDDEQVEMRELKRIFLFLCRNLNVWAEESVSAHKRLQLSFLTMIVCI